MLPDFRLDKLILRTQELNSCLVSCLARSLLNPTPNPLELFPTLIEGPMLNDALQIRDKTSEFTSSPSLGNSRTKTQNQVDREYVSLELGERIYHFRRSYTLKN